MSARPTPVAAVQTGAHDRAEFVKRWPELLARIATAAEAGARLIVVPEGTAPAYVIGSEPVDSTILEPAARDVIAVASGDRRRTDAWRVAPETDVREALVRIGHLISGPPA